jgi:hypothetical protein
VNEHEPEQEPTGAYIQWGISGVPFSAVRVPLLDDERAAAALIQKALRASKFTAEQFAQVFPNAAREDRPQQTRPHGRQQQNRGRPQQGGGRGDGKSRADRYAEIPDLSCDICNGPVGRYPRTGNMRSDKAVCLGRCKDGDYVHTVAWLDDDDGGYDGGYSDDDDSIPF